MCTPFNAPWDHMSVPNCILIRLSVLYGPHRERVVTSARGSTYVFTSWRQCAPTADTRVLGSLRIHTQTAYRLVIRFCRAHSRDQQTGTHRDRQTTQHGTSIAICRTKLMLHINFLHVWPADWAKETKNSKFHKKVEI